MANKYLSLSKEFTGGIVDRWTNTSREQKFVLLGTAAILGTCWGFSKIYFWCQRRKTQQRIEEDRQKLRKDKEELYQELKNDKDLASQKENILKLSFSELQDKLRDGNVTANMVLRAYQLKALEVNPDINAIAHVIPDAQKLAEEYDVNRKSLLLGGIPVTLKDHYTIKGRYGTIGLGSYLFRDAAEDCVIVKVLKKHGAIPYFITTVPQMLMGFDTENPIHGRTYHPTDPDRYPGGSSTGEGALIARGGSILGWGSDIGGSVREPAHYCGICGFKPTPARLSHVGAPDFFEGIATLVQNSFGPMSRDVDGLVQGMRALWDGYMFDLDPSMIPMTFDEEVFKSNRPLRIGYYTDIDGVSRVSPSCKRAVLMAKQRLGSLGHQVVRWDIPNFSRMMGIYVRCFTSNDNPDEANVLMHETEVNYSLNYIFTSKKDRVIRKLRALLQTLSSMLSGGLIPLEKDSGSIADCWNLATEIKRLKNEAWDSWKKTGIDAVICPTSPVPAYKTEHRNINKFAFPFILVHNLLNMPAGVVPVTHVNQDDLNALSDLHDNDLGVKEIKQAMDAGSVGLPITVQVATPTFRDELCLRIMKEIEGLNTGGVHEMPVNFLDNKNFNWCFVEINSQFKTMDNLLVGV